MKQLLMLLLLLCSPVYSHETKESLHIYLCSRLTQQALEWNNIITKELNNDQTLQLFRPQDIDLSNFPKSTRDLAIYEADFAGIDQADLLLVLPPYGRDCAWEIGWFCGAGKVTIAYVETASEWFNDAMVKGGLTAIITNNPTIYQTLLEDEAAADKVHLIASREFLAEAIKKIYYTKISN